jgi:hypothetical protein
VYNYSKHVYNTFYYYIVYSITLIIMDFVILVLKYKNNLDYLIHEIEYSLFKTKSELKVVSAYEDKVI